MCSKNVTNTLLKLIYHIFFENLLISNLNDQNLSLMSFKNILENDLAVQFTV